MKKIKKGLIIGLILIILVIIGMFHLIRIKEITRFECDHIINKPTFRCWTKESLINWSEDAEKKGVFDVSELKNDLKDIDDNQRLIVSVGREISFFYRIRPFKLVKVKYKNDKVTNYVYVYKVNYKGSIIDYTIF